jgi:DNA-binding LytR/AlgR family response regulator
MPTYFIRKGKTTTPVKADQILYFQADVKYTVIAMKDGEQYMASKCLSCIEQLLPADFFLDMRVAMVVYLQSKSILKMNQKLLS